MKYLKYFNEAVITPYDFTDEISILKNTNNITLDFLNNLFKMGGIEFINIEYFKSKLETDKEIELVPIDLNLLSGIKFAAFNPYTHKVYVCVEEVEFIDGINSPKKDSMLSLLEEMLRHETIHKQQVERRPGVLLRNLEVSPLDPKKYFGSSDEIMAYAQSFVDQCHKKGMSNEDILDHIRGGGEIFSWIENVYKSKNMTREITNKFNKYVYEYITK